MPHTPIALNCPKCGRPMQFVKAEDPSGAGFQLYECSTHGVFHFNRTTDLTPGTPPKRT